MPLLQRISFTASVSWILTLGSVAFLAAFVGVLAWQSIPVWREVGPGYLTGSNWFYRSRQFGTLPMLYGSLVVAFIGLAVAAPLGVGAAIWSSELLPPRLRLGVKICVELLAGIPSVIYGLLGILLLRDWIYRLLSPFDPLSGDTLLTAGLLVGIMILPTVMSLSDDALRSVPFAQREAARGLGLNPTETILHVVLPLARPGILASLLLALGRSLGEMIAVFLVVGRRDNQLPDSILSLRPWIESGQTLATKLGSSETNIAYGDPLHWAAMVGLGLILLLLVTAVTLLATRILGKGSPNA